MRMATAAAALVLGTAFCAAQADAQTACVSDPTANVSHFVPMNAQYGGHVAAHVADANPPAGYSQAGKTLFRYTADYDNAWAHLAAQQPPLYCANSPQLGAEAARDVPLYSNNSRYCTAAGNDGVCTAWQTVSTNYVTFVFRAVNLDNRTRWILYTAYPH